MNAAAILASILGAVLIGAISPGPSFVFVSRTSVALSRRDGLAAALGMGLGGAVFATLALLGLTALLARVEWLHAGLKVAGGLYLLYLCVRIWRSAAAPLAIADSLGPRSARVSRSFSLGLVTQISNPKTAVVYASIFAALLPPSPPLWVLLALPPLLFLQEALWYAIVAIAFSADRPRSIYLSARGWIDRAAAAVMGALGLRLIVETVDP